MKKILLFMFLICGFVYGQDTTFAVPQSLTDTLTATVDTIDITFQAEYELIQITLKTTSGTDTVYVQSRTPGSAEWTTKALTRMDNDTTYQNSIATTTALTYLINAPGVRQIRIRTDDVVGACVFTVAGLIKRRY